MARKHSVVLAGVALVVCALLVLSTGHADQGNVKATNSDLVQTAQTALQATQASYDTGRTSVEDVHRWSRRLKEAELKAEPNNRRAVADHLQRMKALESRVISQAKAGVEGGESTAVAAVAYFVAEAQAK